VTALPSFTEGDGNETERSDREKCFCDCLSRRQKGNHDDCDDVEKLEPVGDDEFAMPVPVDSKEVCATIAHVTIKLKNTLIVPGATTT